MALTPATNRQVPDHSIMDHFNKQVYLGNGYSVPISFSLSNTSETAVAWISNPAASGAFPSNNVGLFMEGSHFTCAGNVIIRYYLNPTITSPGTPAACIQRRPANGNTSVALIYPNGQFTVSSNGVLVDIRPALAQAEARSDLLIILDAGQSMLITAQTTASSTNAVTGAIPWNEF